MNHHRESSNDILTSGLMIIKGINNPNSIHFSSTTIHGDPGYNDDECFKLIEDADMGFFNKTKCGPSLAFKFGMTHYNTSHEQRYISENGPALCLGADCSVSNAVCHFFPYRNGTGRVTFLQSTIPSFTHGCFDTSPPIMIWTMCSNSKKFYRRKTLRGLLQARRLLNSMHALIAMIMSWINLWLYDWSCCLAVCCWDLNCALVSFMTIWSILFVLCPKDQTRNV